MRPQSTTKYARLLLARNLRSLRLEKKLSQEALADLAGLHRTYIGSVERGERNVSVDNIQRISEALSVKPRDLLTDD
jgi:transcriptional regulator with XRE-family HTH domain